MKGSIPNVMAESGKYSNTSSVKMVAVEDFLKEEEAKR